MTDSLFPSGALARMITESARRSSTLHRQFLHTRQNDLQNVRALIEMQMMGSIGLTQSVPLPAQTPALFDSRQLDAFGTGRISDCLGPAFARYEGRRIPRIPNGDLKMMSRITAIQGSPRDFRQPASITAEYDVSPDAWYLREGAFPDIPTSLYMEIALQPCGFLSAYLDTYAFAPDEHFSSATWMAACAAWKCWTCAERRLSPGRACSPRWSAAGRSFRSSLTS